MSKQLDTPILLIGFNRPDLTARVLAQIEKIRPRKLYIAIDGPRSESDRLKIVEIKKIIKQIQGKYVVKTKFQQKNLGCKYGPVAAMNWFFKNEEMGIILEDDVLAEDSFFYFCQELLVKYKDDTRVGSISGNNFQFGRQRGAADYYFSRYSHSCGWATWRRAWKLYDIEISDYEEKKNVVLDNVFNKWKDRLYWKLIFRGIRSGELDTAWDYQWNWMMWKHNMLGIIPNVNLVKNIGFGRSDATHTKGGSKFENMKIEKMLLPLKHPNDVGRDFSADELTQGQNYVLWKELIMNLVRKIYLVNRKIISLNH
ncbi:MAG: glycosyl transferase [Microgenomates group bacterium]